MGEGKKLCVGVDGSLQRGPLKRHLERTAHTRIQGGREGRVLAYGKKGLSSIRGQGCRASRIRRKPDGVCRWKEVVPKVVSCACLPAFKFWPDVHRVKGPDVPKFVGPRSCCGATSTLALASACPRVNQSLDASCFR